MDDWHGQGFGPGSPGEGGASEFGPCQTSLRNPTLADAVKRIGIAERTGRGVDLIFEGLLRFGRPSPDYSASTGSAVTVKLSGGQADIAFLRTVLEEEKRRGAPLPVDALIVLTSLRKERRMSAADLAKVIQRPETAARTVLERLVETGLIEAHGTTHRSYTLSSRLYRQTGESAAYVRQSGIEPIRHEEMVLKLAKAQGSIKRADVVGLCRLTEGQAKRLLSRLVKDGRLTQKGEKRGTIYVL